MNGCRALLLVAFFALSPFEKAIAQETSAGTESENMDPEVARKINTLTERLGPRWLAVYLDADGERLISIDKKSAPAPIGNKMYRLWFRWDFLKPRTVANEEQFDSFIEQCEVDCASTRMRILKTSYYLKNEFTRELVWDNAQWDSPTPDSTFEAMLMNTCEGALPEILAKKEQ